VGLIGMSPQLYSYKQEKEERLTSSCFNAFSRVDIRVDVKIPGGVEAYVVDLRGERYVHSSLAMSMSPRGRDEREKEADGRHEATPEMWTETYLSAILRAIRYADDASYRLAGYRKLDPITTIEGESRFLKAAEELFFQGMSPSHVTSLYCSSIPWVGRPGKGKEKERRRRR